MTRREVVRVRDVAQVIGGATPRTSEPAFWGGTIPWLTPKDLSDRPARYTDRGTRFISDQGLSSSSARLLPAGSVLLTSRAPIGLVTIASAPIATNQGFKSLVLDETQCPEYWYYLLASSGEYLHSVANGSTFLEISGKVVGDLEFEVPSIDEQRRIAEVLGALDDLIDMNERLANSQTELAKSHGQRLLPRLSEGDSGTIDDIATIAKGYSYKSAELVEGGGWLVGLKNVGRRGEFRADGFKPLIAEVKPSQVVDNGDLVVAHTDLTQAREVIGRPVRVRRGKREGTLVASLDLAVVRPKSGVSVEYRQAVLESAAFREHALGYCNGTTVLHMSSQAVPSFPVAVPTAEGMRAFDELATLRAGADDAHDAADELRRTRDELLPLLMSGAVRVRPEEVAA